MFPLMRPLATWAQPEVVLSGEITQDLTLTTANRYLLRGYVYVKNGATLTIEPGVVIRGERATKGSLIITRSGYIQALGTAEQPIVFTSNQPEGQRAPGDWGGIVILGSAPTNCIGDCLIEGGLNNTAGDGLYGGPDPNDSSGVFRYVRIDWPGVAVQPDNEINGLTLGGVGRRTVIDHVQVSFSGDDAFEFFGGTVQASHLVSLGAIDDDFDTDFGWQGAVQFALAIRYPNRFDVSLSNGFESDNSKQGFANPPLTAGVFSNVTLVGPRFPGAGTPSTQFQAGMNLRSATRLRVFNSLVMGWPRGLLIEGTTCEGYALSGALRVAHNVTSDCPTPYELDLKGAPITLNITQWWDNNLNQDIPAVSDLKLADPYNLNRPRYTTDATSPLRSGADFTDSIVTRYAGFWQPVAYRGAFGADDWTTCWTNWTPQFNQPQTPEPCAVTGIGNLGNSDHNSNISLLASPNPATTALTLSTPALQGLHHVDVLDAQGRTVLTLDGQGAPSLTLDVAALPAGLYIVRVGGMGQSLRFIKP